MLNELQNYLTFEGIYLWVNFGILPFWLMIIFIPNLKITQFLVNSIIIPLILTSIYCYIVYQGFLLGDNFFLENFNLYLGLDNLYTIFSNEIFLLTFWLHFVALNIFFGIMGLKRCCKIQYFSGNSIFPNSSNLLYWPAGTYLILVY